MKRTLSASLLIAALLFVFPVGADELEDLHSVVKYQLDQSLAEYKQISANIASEKVPLVSEISSLEIENIQLRKELASLKFVAENKKSELEELKQELEAVSSENDYTHRVFNEYLGNFESRLHVAEDQRFKIELTRKRAELDVPGISRAYVSGLYAKVLDMSIGRLEETLGGYQFEGRSIDSDGNFLNGQIAVLGPTGYFSTENGESAGLLLYHSGTLEPGFIPFQSNHADSIRQFIQNGTGEIPFDASLGNAISLQEINLTLAQHIRQGGPVGYAILALGGIALLLCLVKLGDLGRHASVSSDQVRDIARCARQESPDKALESAKGIKGAIGEILQTGIENVHSNAIFLEEMMLSVISRRRPELERFLPFVSITAMAAPLLGLLGTVVGMIRTFALITVFGTGDPKSLSSGISEALVTTELGLSVAIVTLLLHALLARVIKRRLSLMEQVVFDFVRAAILQEPRKA